MRTATFVLVLLTTLFVVIIGTVHLATSVAYA